MHVSQQMATGIDSFALLAIPFFILSGLFMGHGGIARRLINFANVLVGGFRGGLAFVDIFTCMLFGSISGSAAAGCDALHVKNAMRAETVLIRAIARLLSPRGHMAVTVSMRLSAVGLIGKLGSRLCPMQWCSPERHEEVVVWLWRATLQPRPSSHPRIARRPEGTEGLTGL